MCFIFKKIAFILLGIIGIFSMAFGDIIQCPSGTEFIATHDPIRQVITKCGQPLHKIAINPKRVRILEVWQYVKPNVNAFNGKEQGFSVVFVHGNVIQINADNNKNLNSLSCSRGQIGIGSTRRQVEHACGVPYSTRNVHPLAGKEYINVPQIVKLVYKPRRYLPETVLVFVDGALIGKVKE